MKTQMLTQTQKMMSNYELISQLGTQKSKPSRGVPTKSELHEVLADKKYRPNYSSTSKSNWFPFSFVKFPTLNSHQYPHSKKLNM